MLLKRGGDMSVEGRRGERAVLNLRFPKREGATDDEGGDQTCEQGFAGR